MIFVAVTSHLEAPREVNTFWRVGMHLSVEGSAEAVSEIIIMEAVSFCWSAIVAWDCCLGLFGGIDGWLVDGMRSRSRKRELLRRCSRNQQE